jgi:hypothetical protein
MWNGSSSATAVKAFSAGARPRVFYSPGHPQDSLLLPGLHASNFARMGFGILFCSFSGLFGILLPQLKRYGTVGPGGEVSFAPDSPATKYILSAMVLIGVEFAVLFWLCRS